ncbi:MAG: gephyrin-like molybdotransferase Glp [Candidatus Dormibacteria bacterium]|jgi:molybdopterin molybdotransferase
MLTHAVSNDLESVATAQQRLLEKVGVLTPEVVSLDAALGRILAETVSSQSDLPGFDNSAMDGYAVRASDIARASASEPATLPVVGESRAGALPGTHAAGTAMRIMTGAPMPEGADTVVRQEDTRRDGAMVLIEVATGLGTSVRPRGADIRRGDDVILPGQALTSVDVGVAAALGHDRLLVGARPRVALLATGDELVPAGTAPGPAHLVDSNSPMLTAAVREAGGIPTFLGIARDSKASLRELLQAASASDLVVSSAGVSVGDHDWVREVVAELGTISTWRVAMRPGKPVLIGRIGNAVFIGLPGNPVSSSVTFELFARPVIRRMQGARELQRRRIRVRLGEAMSKPAALETYSRAVLHTSDDDELAIAHSSGDQGSSMLQSLTRADCLVVLPAGPEVVEAGTVVEAIPLR